MNVVIASPYLDDMRGNSITAKRMIHLLNSLGVQVCGVNYRAPLHIREFHQEIEQCQCLHILNPVRYIDSALYETAIHQQKCYGITFTGTDVNLYLDAQNWRLVDLLRGAAFIVVFHSESKAKILSIIPDLSVAIHIIAQGFFTVLAEEGVSPTQQSSSVCEKEQHGKSVLEEIEKLQSQGHTVIILPAGIRKVKQVPWAIELINRYAEHSCQPVILYIVGPCIEEAEAAIVNQLVAATDNAYYAGEIPHFWMVEAIQKADILLNCSQSEGQSLAIIEAFFVQTPVIANSSTGNEDMIIDQTNGLLFTSEQEFFTKLNLLINNQAIRDKIVADAYQRAIVTYSAEQEMIQYRELYQQSCKGR